MNDKQKIAFWAGLIIFQLMIIFPPVSRLQAASERVNGSIVTGRTHNYGLILRDYKNVNFGLLAAQTGILAILTGGLIYTFREKDKQETGH